MRNYEKGNDELVDVNSFDFYPQANRQEGKSREIVDYFKQYVQGILSFEAIKKCPFACSALSQEQFPIFFKGNYVVRNEFASCNTRPYPKTSP